MLGGGGRWGWGSSHPNELVRSMPTPTLNELFDLRSHWAERPVVIDILEYLMVKFTLRAMVNLLDSSCPSTVFEACELKMQILTLNKW